MTLNNILVALDGSPASDVALQGAVSIHKAYNAHVSAMVSLNVQTGASGDIFPWVPAAIRKNIEKAASDAHDAVERAFMEATRDLDQEKVHMIERVTATDTSVSEASRFFDFTVVGIPTDMESSKLHPDRIALLSGRPVMAFPEGNDATRVADKAAIAWDGSRAAARALSSSMRVLSTKEDVILITVDAPPKAKVENSGLDPKTALERQGIAANWINADSKGRGIATTLLASAKDHGAEILIMGAFEHSKFREDLFGGVTRDVMAATDIPVFLAH
ncbi:MAG: universal stress protein [Pseudomonadota bacterium]